jgi:hypothetical protein
MAVLGCSRPALLEAILAEAQRRMPIKHRDSHGGSAQRQLWQCIDAMDALGLPLKASRVPCAECGGLLWLRRDLW